MNLCLIFHLSWVCLLKLAHVAYVWYVCVYLHGEMALLLSNTTLPRTHSPRTSPLPLPPLLPLSLSHSVDILVASCGFVLPIWMLLFRIFLICETFDRLPLSANSLCFHLHLLDSNSGKTAPAVPTFISYLGHGAMELFHSVTNLARFESRSSINCRQIVFSEVCLQDSCEKLIKTFAKSSQMNNGRVVKQIGIPHGSHDRREDTLS